MFSVEFQFTYAFLIFKEKTLFFFLEKKSIETQKSERPSIENRNYPLMILSRALITFPLQTAPQAKVEAQYPQQHYFPLLKHDRK